MEAIKFNVEQDFQVFVTLPEAVSDGKFMITLFAGGAKYSAVYDGESYKNCRRINDTTIVVLVDNHHLKCGEVDVEIRLEIPDESMPDGNFKYVTRKPVTISVDGVDKTLFLHHGESESLELASVNFEILELALFYGFFATEEELPKPTRAGYAYVGAINEFDVYVTNARTWHNSGVKASSITEDVKAVANRAKEMADLASKEANAAKSAADNAEQTVNNLREGLTNFMTAQGEDIRGAILLMQKVGDTVEKMGLAAKEQGENAASQGANAENSALMADEATKKATYAAALATEKANLANNKARFADEQGEAARDAAQSANTAAGNAQKAADKVEEEWEQKSEEWNDQISTAVSTSAQISAYAENVNAQLSGATITITNRNGESRTFELPTVEDSLESEDANKALSAKQGKGLGGKLTELSRKVTGTQVFNVKSQKGAPFLSEAFPFDPTKKCIFKCVANPDPNQSVYRVILTFYDADGVMQGSGSYVSLIGTEFIYTANRFPSATSFKFNFNAYHQKGDYAFSMFVEGEDLITKKEAKEDIDKAQNEAVDKSQTLFSIPNAYIRNGSLYNGNYDTSVKTAVSTRLEALIPCNSKYIYAYGHHGGISKPSIRVTYYTASKTFLSQTAYQTDNVFAVPANAVYYRLTFNFTGLSSVSAEDFAFGELSCNSDMAKAVDTQQDTLFAPIFTGSGYISIDNATKEIRTNGFLTYIRRGAVQSIPSGLTASIENVTIARGTRYVLAYDIATNVLSVALVNENLDNTVPLYGKCIICAFTIKTNAIYRDSILYTAVRCVIDNDTLVDETKVISHCSKMNTDNRVDSFVFFTDPHVFNTSFYNLDTDRNFSILKEYHTAVGSPKCICGGDWMDHEDNEALACKKIAYWTGWMRENFKDYIPIVGNHDYNKYKTEHLKLPYGTLRNLTCDGGNCYFHVDNPNSRYYIFDSGIDSTWGSMDADRWKQIEWFANRLKDNIERNVLFIHIGFGTNNVPSAFIDNLTKIANAYNNKTSISLNGNTYDFSSCVGRVYCVISGHKHSDVSDVVNNIRVVATINFTNGDTASFDLCALDYDANKLYMTRVGSGDSREVDL